MIRIIIECIFSRLMQNFYIVQIFQKSMHQHVPPNPLIASIVTHVQCNADIFKEVVHTLHNFKKYHCAQTYHAC